MAKIIIQNLYEIFSFLVANLKLKIENSLF